MYKPIDLISPTPWRNDYQPATGFGCGYGRSQIIDAEGKAIAGVAAVQPNGNLPMYENGGLSRATFDTLEANARMMVASFELFTALKGLQRAPGCFCEHGVGNPMVSNHSQACVAANAAIKKATGEELPQEPEPQKPETMGYGHSYNVLDIDQDFMASQILEDVKAIIRKSDTLLGDGGGTANSIPVLHESLIQFNGRQPMRGMQFRYPPDIRYNRHYLEPERIGTHYCITNRQPYDRVVCAALISIKRNLGDNVVIKSDGLPESMEWRQAMKLYRDATGRAGVPIDLFVDLDSA